MNIYLQWIYTVNKLKKSIIWKKEISPYVPNLVQTLPFDLIYTGIAFLAFIQALRFWLGTNTSK